MRVIAALFSMLMPGFGQIYNQQYIKGIFFVILEHYDNVSANINKAIQLDFNGFRQQALETVIYDGLLFYPGFYIYAVWDAWFYAKEGANKTKTAIPFIIGGFLGEFSSIYSSKIPIPSLTSVLLMIIPMIIGLIVFRKQ